MASKSVPQASSSRITLMMKRGAAGIEQARVSIMNYEAVTSGQCKSTVNRQKIQGVILHVAKAKKLVYVKGPAEKRSKKEANFHRLVFCR